MNGATSMPPTLHRPRPLVVAWTLSILAHGALLTGGAALPFSAAQPSAWREMQVTLAMPATLATPARPRAAATVMTATSNPHTPASDAVAESVAGDQLDEPLVASRYDAATLNNPKPPYPLAARRQGVQGRVVLRTQVLEDGRCAQVDIVRSSGHAALDESALTTVRRWRFLPATRAGMPVASWVEVPIVFRLDAASGGSTLQATR